MKSIKDALVRSPDTIDHGSEQEPFKFCLAFFCFVFGTNSSSISGLTLFFLFFFFLAHNVFSDALL